ncbi:DNA-processing protein DprA [Brockia lithotrophica]|uniref:DNA protecting protein DprA n=1 Tax=Brockia lithotrophica TaxID=933949 RepID=A0A660KTV9_9BACL|nr:DNA-processing protein DprA [Brockia lithotrophica]RKQ84180.1 DNA protecting protein DprA [Brockia lithotrophica]
MTEADLLAAAVLHGVHGVGQRRLWRVYELLSGAFHLLCTREGWERVRAGRALPEDVLRAAEEHFARICGGGEVPPKPRDVRILWWGDSEYPRGLREISDPPFLLYARGDLDALALPPVAVVGTRRPTAYGLLVAERFAAGFVAEGAAVVSGMAFGIDAAAHRSALRARGRTVAVLASGVDVPTPAAHRRLYEEILAGGGLVLSEMPLGTAAERGLFPLRNRLLSGVSRAVLVVESRPRGGAMLTAEWAQTHGRLLFAVPGPVFSPASEGPNRLLAAGARPALSPGEVLAHLSSESPGEFRPSSQAEGAFRPPPPQDKEAGAAPESPSARRAFAPEEQAILARLGAAPRTIEELLRELSLEPSALYALLIRLELAGLVRRLPGGRYARAEEK